MKKLLLILVLATAMLVAGCTSTPESITIPELTTPPEPTMPVEPSQEEADPDATTRTETTNDTEITYVEDRGIPDLLEGFGIYGASVELDGVYPGWSGTVPLTLVNGQDRDRLFVIYAVSPVKTIEGFEALPEKYLYWLTVEEPEVTVPEGEVRQINITLAIPHDVDYAGKFAEVRIRVDDTTQSGLVQIALESKWFIITAD